MPIRILIADDHVLIRTGLLVLLKDVPDMEVVGEASNGIEALKLMEKCQPDVILMDLLMPGIDEPDRACAPS